MGLYRSTAGVIPPLAYDLFHTGLNLNNTLPILLYLGEVFGKYLSSSEHERSERRSPSQPSIDGDWPETRGSFPQKRVNTITTNSRPLHVHILITGRSEDFSSHPAQACHNHCATPEPPLLVAAAGRERWDFCVPMTRSPAFGSAAEPHKAPRSFLMPCPLSEPGTLSRTGY